MHEFSVCKLLLPVVYVSNTFFPRQALDPFFIICQYLSLYKSTIRDRFEQNVSYIRSGTHKGTSFGVAHTEH